MSVCSNMGVPKTLLKLMLQFTLLCCAGLSHARSSENQSHGTNGQEYNVGDTDKSTLTGCNNQTLRLAVSPGCQDLQQPNFVWTDYIKDGQFGIFRFGIKISKDTKQFGKMVRDTISQSSVVQVRGNEQVNVTVTAETNRSDTMLIIISCQVVGGQNITRTFFIQDGCLDNKTTEEIKREHNEMVFSLRLSGLRLTPGSSVVRVAKEKVALFITCDVKLCRSTNHSQPCGSRCPHTVSLPYSIDSLLETGIYHVTTKPIYTVIQSRRASTNYAALFIGLVLGGTVVAVVVLLVRKSFSGVRRRNTSVEL